LPGDFQVLIKPDDNFNGYRNNLGIGEPAEVLAVKRENTNHTVIFSRMEVFSGENSDGSAVLIKTGDSTIQAGPYQGSATVKVWAYVNGTTEAGPVTVTVNILEPTGLKIVNKPNSSVRHKDNSYSIAIWGKIYLLPNTVSFHNITIYEGEDPTGNGTGCLQEVEVCHPENGPHKTVTGIQMETMQPNTINGDDDILFEANNLTLLPPGSFTWTMKWRFEYGSNKKNFAQHSQIFNILNNGKMTVKKDEAFGTVNYSDTGLPW
jgi:hypothetical protein